MKKENESVLIEVAQGGNKDALEELLARYQHWIYNLSLKMVFINSDAEDLTQEVLLKIAQSIKSFKMQSAFKTWVYRIVVNHMITMQKRQYEHFTNFDEIDLEIKKLPDLPLSGEYDDAHKVLLVEEAKLGCVAAMLMCLDREQRLILLVADVMGVEESVASEIFNISGSNLRKKLSRARSDLYIFMNNKCGLINETNPCRCEKKTKALIESGYVDSQKLIFANHFIKQVQDEQAILSEALCTLEEQYANLLRSQQFDSPKTMIPKVISLLATKNLYKFH
jgi:RNA polymerase sigma factor (sigma-70 family)